MPQPQPYLLFMVILVVAINQQYLPEHLQQQVLGFQTHERCLAGIPNFQTHSGPWLHSHPKIAFKTLKKTLFFQPGPSEHTAQIKPLPPFCFSKTHKYILQHIPDI